MSTQRATDSCACSEGPSLIAHCTCGSVRYSIAWNGPPIRPPHVPAELISIDGADLLTVRVHAGTAMEHVCAMCDTVLFLTDADRIPGRVVLQPGRLMVDAPDGCY